MFLLFLAVIIVGKEVVRSSITPEFWEMMIIAENARKIYSVRRKTVQCHQRKRTSKLTIDDDTDGIIVLDEDANKLGLELRLYLHHRPDCVTATRNTVYRSEYFYRINDTDVISEMFDLGYRIGLNNAW